jgi:hypothetical protein
VGFEVPSASSLTPPALQGQVEGQGAVPQAFECPISCTVMQDPVMAQDGHTYERSAIETWIAKAAQGALPGLTTREGWRRDARSSPLMSTVAVVPMCVTDGVLLRSPMTNQPMGPEVMVNITLRKAVEEALRERQPLRPGS